MAELAQTREQLASFALPLPIARPQTGVLPNALWRGREGVGGRADGNFGRAPPPSLPHESLRPGARKRGPGGGGGAASAVCELRGA
jgi:hypothetical protein